MPGRLGGGARSTAAARRPLDAKPILSYDLICRRGKSRRRHYYHNERVVRPQGRCYFHYTRVDLIEWERARARHQRLLIH